MQHDLNQFERNMNTYNSTKRPPSNRKKWIFRNQLDEIRNDIRNKARLVAKGYNQEEDIDFNETFAPATQLEAIRILLAFTSHMNMKLYQIDVKRTFLNGYL